MRSKRAEPAGSFTPTLPVRTHINEAAEHQRHPQGVRGESQGQWRQDHGKDGMKLPRIVKRLSSPSEGLHSRFRFVTGAVKARRVCVTFQEFILLRI